MEEQLKQQRAAIQQKRLSEQNRNSGIQTKSILGSGHKIVHLQPSSLQTTKASVSIF